MCEHAAELVQNELGGVLDRHEPPAILDERFECREAIGADAAAILGRYGACRTDSRGGGRAVTIEDRAARLSRKHDHVEPLAQIRDAEITVSQGGVAEPELLEEPPEPAFVDARNPAPIESDACRPNVPDLVPRWLPQSGRIDAKRPHGRCQCRRFVSRAWCHQKGTW